MDIPVDAPVFCIDGLCGRSTHVVVRPTTEEVTHLVIKEKEPPHQERLVPIDAVTVSTPDSINLRYTRHQVTKLQPFIEVEHVRIDLPRATGASSIATPFLYAEHETRSVRHEAIPQDELAVCRGASVQATDGHVGRVDEFLIDPDTDVITHLVLREGHLWGEREVTIPVSEIKHLGENTVFLKTDKHKIGALPHTARRRG